MRVLVIGTGGREHAIAWACEQHGHTVDVRADLGETGPDDVDLVIPGPEAALVAGVADEVTTMSGRERLLSVKCRVCVVEEVVARFLVVGVEG